MTLEIRANDRNEYECVWGQFDNAEANPNRELKHLMLTTAGYVKELMEEGPKDGPFGGAHSVSFDGQRTFAHLDIDGGRTTWELFPACWWDDGGPDDILVGRWPD